MSQNRTSGKTTDAGRPCHSAPVQARFCTYFHAGTGRCTMDAARALVSDRQAAEDATAGDARTDAKGTNGE